MRKDCLSKILLTILFTLVLSISAHARLATYEDAPAEIEFESSELDIAEDGSSVEIYEKQIKILNETGRSTYGDERLSYNENHQSVEILEAKTIINGKEYKVPPNMIEVKPLASEIQGFDQLFQILISFPNLEIGSRTYVKYKIIDKKQPLPNYFATKIYYGLGAYLKKAQLKIKSKLKLQTMINDPSNRLNVKQYSEGKNNIIEVNLKKPAYDDLINESPQSQMPDHLRTWISVSTYKTNDDFAKDAAKDYETVLQQKLPPLFETIGREASLKDNPIDQMNTVTSMLADKLRYMGDWRTIKGKFGPRNLTDIAESGVGDCKDFSAATVAILRTLGYKAQVAITTRGIAYLPPEKSLPGYLGYNHAITKIVDKGGKTYWIDPTNFTSMATGIFPDISARPVLVLDSQNPSLESVPAIDYLHSSVIVEDIINIKQNDVLSRVGSTTMKGEAAQQATGASLSHSLQSIEEAIIKELSGEATPANKKLTMPPLDSRIVKDITIGYSFDQENALLLTNQGLGILLSFVWSQPFIDISDDQIGTIYVGLPETIHKKTIVKNVDVTDMEKLAYEIKTPWVEAKRECHNTDQGIEINDYICILKSFISAKETKSKEYKKLKDVLKKYCTKFALIITKNENKKSPSSPLATGG